jgi:zinc transporter ZupT
MSGIGGLFYVALLGLAIITRRYKSNKRNMSARRVALGVLIFVFATVLIGGLQAFKVFDINSLVFFKIKDGVSSSILKIGYQKWWTKMAEGTSSTNAYSLTIGFIMYDLLALI